MKHLSWIFTLPITVIVVLFAISNTSSTTLRVRPFPWEVELPLYLVILGALFVGFLLGAVLAWLSGGWRRRQARQLADQVRAQSRRIAELERQRAEEAKAGSRAVPVIMPPAKASADERRVAQVSAR